MTIAALYITYSTNDLESTIHARIKPAVVFVVDLDDKVARYGPPFIVL